MADPLRQLANRHFFNASDIVYLPSRPFVIDQHEQRTHAVSYMREATALGTVAVNRDWSIVERLLDETRHDHPILAGLPWPNSIEQADDHGRQALFAPIGNREEFVHRFRAGVTPS